MRRIGGAAHERGTPAKDPACHTRRDHEDEQDGDQAVGVCPVIARKQEVDIRDGGEQRAGRDEARRRGAAVDGVAAPRDGGARDRMANWARHAAPMMADSAYFAETRRKSPTY